MNGPRQPQSVILPSSLLIDPSKEPLHIVIKPYKGVKEIPPELRFSQGPDLMVFVELNKCFQKAGFIAEGMLANVMWGFEQCGFDPRHVAAGLTALRTSGFIEYTDERRVLISEYNWDPKKPIWIRYTPKMLDYFVRELILEP